MNDTLPLQQIRQILGCDEPWYIRRFSASLEPHRIQVWLDHRAVVWPCPTPACERTLACGGHACEKVFLCLACHEPEAHVHVMVPYVICPHHGAQEVPVPWMRDPSRWRLVRRIAASASEDSTIH
jgi:hypothetical protein